MSREQLSEIISGLDDRHIVEAIRYSPEDAASPERIEHMKRKRIFTIALAAALILALGAAAYAISGIPRSTGTHHMPRVAEYTSLSDLPKIEKDVGYPVTAPERFSNGYAFKGLRVNGQAVFGEDNEVLREYYGVSVTYTKDGERDLYLELSPVLRLEGGTPPREPSERRELNGVELRLNLDHYKFVPADYDGSAAYPLLMFMRRRRMILRTKRQDTTSSPTARTRFRSARSPRWNSSSATWYISLWTWTQTPRPSTRLLEWHRRSLRRHKTEVNFKRWSLILFSRSRLCLLHFLMILVNVREEIHSI